MQMHLNMTLIYLRYDTLCPKWIEEVDDNPDVVMDRKLFEGTNEFRNMLESVNERLAGEQELDEPYFSEDDIRVVYNLCRYQKALRPGQKSIWCAAFSKQDLEVIRAVINRL